MKHTDRKRPADMKTASERLKWAKGAIVRQKKRLWMAYVIFGLALAGCIWNLVDFFNQNIQQGLPWYSIIVLVISIVYIALRLLQMSLLNPAAATETDNLKNE